MSSKPQTRRQVVAGGLASLTAPILAGCSSRNGSKTEAELQKHRNDSNPLSTELQSIAQVVKPTEKHWVGDGFRVSTLFSPHIVDSQVLSPFVLLDHASPKRFEPTTKPRGVGEHPHRGFETVTFAYQGEVAHRDSHGGGGVIGAGDVQWMTAASGVVHEEFHSEAFTKSGGIFEMVQLWVNLPAKDKMSSPRYQRLLGTTFPSIQLGGGTARLIAGEFLGARGPAETHSAITMFDLQMDGGDEISFRLSGETTTLLVMLEGRATAQAETSVSEGELVVMDRSSVGDIRLLGKEKTRILVLNGEPLNEPVVAHGPFVMNTKAEIVEAIRDYQSGKMGKLAPTQGS